jgi:hypothetical protein
MCRAGSANTGAEPSGQRAPAIAASQYCGVAAAVPLSAKDGNPAPSNVNITQLTSKRRAVEPPLPEKHLFMYTLSAGENAVFPCGSRRDILARFCHGPI